MSAVLMGVSSCEFTVHLEMELSGFDKPLLLIRAVVRLELVGGRLLKTTQPKRYQIWFTDPANFINLNLGTTEFLRFGSARQLFQVNLIVFVL